MSYLDQLVAAAGFISDSKVAEIVDLLSRPERIVSVNLPVRMDNGSLRFFQGFRVQYNSLLGPYKGGIRYHPRVTADEVTVLAFWMTIKNAAADLPLGGGKGGVTVDPKKLSEAELKRLTRAYASSISDLIGPYKDIPAPDAGTNPKIMGWFAEEYKSKVKSQKSKVETTENELDAVVTGKPVDRGGSEGREEATGLGGLFVLQALLAKRSSKFKVQSSKLTAAVQGFGNVGFHTARLLAENGFRVAAVSDSRGAIAAKPGSRGWNEGLNMELTLKGKREKGMVSGCYCVGSVCDLKNRDAVRISNEELLELPVDVLVPAALEGVINEKNAGRIKAKIILEMANGPITPEADKILKEHGVTAIPDVLSNSGGVVVSYFEWLQNIKGEHWTREEVRAKLKEKITASAGAVFRIAREHQTTLRTAAFILALQRLARKR